MSKSFTVIVTKVVKKKFVCSVLSVHKLTGYSHRWLLHFRNTSWLGSFFPSLARLGHIIKPYSIKKLNTEHIDYSDWGRGQGQGQWSSRSRPRPRPDLFEAKAKAKATIFCPRAVLEPSSRSRTVLKDPRPCLEQPFIENDETNAHQNLDIQEQ